MSGQRVSKIALDIITNDERFNHMNQVAYGDLDLLHEIFNRTGHKMDFPHPLKVHQYVLNAIGKESMRPGAIFRKAYFKTTTQARIFLLREPKPALV